MRRHPRAQIALVPLLLAWATPLAAQTAGATAPAPEQQQQQQHRTVTTPDGSRFLLVDSGAGSSLVHWAIATPTGPLVDPREWPGLARAACRASLAGTESVGSLNPIDEAAALRRVEAAERACATARATDGTLDAERHADLLAEFTKSRAELAKLQNAAAWLDQLRAAPALDIDLTETEYASVLQITTTSAGLAKVAYMLMDRREHARLRSIMTDYANVVAEAQPAGRIADRVRARAEVRDLAFAGLGTAVGRAPADLDRAVARSTYRRTHNPAAAFHVLVGALDLDATAELLAAQFRSSELRAVPVPPPQLGLRSKLRSSTVDAELQSGVLVGLEAPATLDRQQTAILADWLANGPGSYVATALRAAGLVDVQVEVSYPFPQSASQGLILIEAWRTDLGAGADGSEALRTALRTALDNTELRVNWQDLQHARNRAALLPRVLAADPRELALRLALQCGTRGVMPETLIDTDIAAARWQEYQTWTRDFLANARRVFVEVRLP